MSSTTAQKLNEQEFSKAVELTFKAFDKTGDGFMPKQDFFNLLGQIKGLDFPMTQALGENLYGRVDLKKDGKIDLQEFYSVLREFYYNR